MTLNAYLGVVGTEGAAGFGALMAGVGGEIGIIVSKALIEGEALAGAGQQVVGRLALVAHFPATHCTVGSAGSTQAVVGGHHRIDGRRGVEAAARMYALQSLRRQQQGGQAGEALRGSARLAAWIGSAAGPTLVVGVSIGGQGALFHALA